MRFSVQLLAITATVLSFNATPQASSTPLPSSVLTPSVQPAAATVDEEMRMATAPVDAPASHASPFAWLLAAGFLTLVVLRRTRSAPLE
ncbi:MAG TPA: hypothetical protein VH040_09860 [Usitatibacter sp.]|jgi:hypothetical protein|nr:hypothetical protein [Usitatibacter sp.]